MRGFKQAVLGTAAVAAVACAPIATAGAHGFGHLHSWGLGRGLLGAAFGLVTLPIAIASAALSANEPDAPYQSSPSYGGPRGYAPPAYYPPPPAYYVPPQANYASPQANYASPQTYYAQPPAYYASSRAYYPRVPVYSAAPRAYYAPRTYYAPRAAYYGGYASYRPGAYAYPRR